MGKTWEKGEGKLRDQHWKRPRIWYNSNLLGGKRRFQRQFQTTLGLPNEQWAEIKSPWKYSWTFYAHSNQFIPLNVQEKAQKADGIKKLTKKRIFFQRQFSIILRLKMTFLHNKNYLNATIRLFDICEIVLFSKVP